MTVRKSTKRAPDSKRKQVPVDGAEEVDAFLRDLDHPLKKEVEAVRQIILGASARIHEGIKWKSPSFRTASPGSETEEYFATVNLRDGRVWLILHTGAKAKDNGMTIEDPKGLLKWLAKDRALVTFEDAKAVKAKRTALAAIIRQWIRCV